MAEAGQEELVQSSLWRIHAQLYRGNQMQKYLTPEPCIICPGCAEAIPGDLSPGSYHLDSTPALPVSVSCVHKAMSSNESGHQLLCLTSSAILLLSYVGPHKGNPMLCREGPFPSSGPVLQLLLADLALPTNTLHQQV